MILKKILKQKQLQKSLNYKEFGAQNNIDNALIKQEKDGQKIIKQEKLSNINFQDTQEISKFEKKQCKRCHYFLVIVVVIIFISQIYYLSSLQKQQNLLSQQSLSKTLNIEQKSSVIIQNLQQKRRLQKLQKNITKYFSNVLNEQLKSIQKYYDLFHFIQNPEISKSPFIFQKALALNFSNIKKIEKRPLVQNSKSNQEIQQIMGKMMFPEYRPQKFPDWQILKNRSQSNIDMSYFFYELSNHPNKKQYLLAEYYRYQKFYNIDLYQQQLPLCIVVAGKNNENNIKRMYDSIKRQNYTNYRVIHIDDSSNDATVEVALKYFLDNRQIKQKVTLISQRYQRNTLYNRNYAIMNYCEDNDIVLELDADDWLIGSQVFQLVNSVYQAKNIYKGQRYDVWAAYFGNIQFIPNCCPLASKSGPFSSQSKKTAPLRTYLRKIYSKINQSQLIDEVAIRKGQFFNSVAEEHIQKSIFQMAGPLHIRYVDQHLYYRRNSQKPISLDSKYSNLAAESMQPYIQLKNIESDPIRNKSFVTLDQKLQSLSKIKSKIQKKRQQLKSKVLKQYQKYLYGMLTYINIEQKIVFNDGNRVKKFGDFQPMKIKVLRESNSISNKFKFQQFILPVSELDDANLTKSIDFSKVQKNLFDTLSHQVLTFKKNERLQIQQKIIYDKFITQLELSIYVKNVDAIDPNNRIISDDFQYSLASLLLQEKISKTTKEVEYYYTNKKYQIQKQSDESSICIFSYNFGAHSYSDYQIFLNSMEKLNYTNFKIIWVDDNSIGNSAYGLYNYTKYRQTKIKNRIKIIRNLHQVGYLGSAHLHIKNYCDSNDIVLAQKGENRLIGTQSLKILNSMYKNPQTWIVYSRFLETSQDAHRYWRGNPSQYFTQQLSQEQHSLSQTTIFPFISFRKLLLDSIPLEYFIQYGYNQETNQAWPQYYNFSGEYILMSSLFSICGKDRIQGISQYLFLSKAKQINECQKKCQLFDIYKSKIKSPLVASNSLGQKAVFKTDYHAPEQTFVKLKQYYSFCEKCLKQIDI